VLAPGDAARAAIRKIVELGAHYGLSVAGEIRVGDDPPKTMLGAVRAGNHDLPVMGVSPRPGEELLFGDVARTVLGDASCSLLFCLRRAARGDAFCRGGHRSRVPADEMDSRAQTHQAVAPECTVRPRGTAMRNPTTCSHRVRPTNTRRRALLKSALGAALAAGCAAAGLGGAQLAFAAALTKEERDQLTPDQVLARLREGNERFRSGKIDFHDYLAQKRATVGGQYPAAAILSCIDSRAPAEIILDTGLGETFNARVAGNIANDDILGSLEFACAAAGAKLIVVMGHTACGAIKGAIDGVQLGHLTGLLDKIKPAVAATSYSGERSSKNAQFVDAVAAENVRRTVAAIRQQSRVLADLETQGKLKFAGSMYHLSGGLVEFMT
jgi:carbonic anhydrase